MPALTPAARAEHSGSSAVHHWSGTITTTTIIIIIIIITITITITITTKDGRARPYGWTASLATLSKGLPDAVAARRRILAALWDNLLRGRERYAKALCWESVGTWGWG